ncbi:MAG TPA: antibiotic biosynthesis monooxygenase [Gemmatimonadaceae bacterium]|nr:antibiotic biosynthesis monooxygenase [Gemmatimonadaceae bacterium]
MTSPTTPQTHDAAASSSRHVSWMFELAVREGRDAEFRALMAEMAAATERGEPGALDYEWYVTDDGRRLHLFERYADAGAAMTHLATFGERYMRRFFDVLAPERITVYGAPDDRVRGALAQLAPQVMARAAGFSR